MKFQLRDYQQNASNAAISHYKLKNGRNYLMVLPTGAGKSLIIADIAARLNEPLLVFQPNKEILEQNFAKLQTYGIFDAGCYSASVKRKDINRITFATIGSYIITWKISSISGIFLLMNAIWLIRQKECMLISSQLLRDVLSDLLLLLTDCAAR